MTGKSAKKQVKHTFKISLPEAKEVKLCGNFNNWDENSLLLKKRKGVWSTSLKLEPGRYEYKLLVDGVWCTDPNAEKVVNPFGGENSVVVI